MASPSEEYIPTDDLERMNIKNIYVKQVPVGEEKGLPKAYAHESSPRGAIFIANYRIFNDETLLEERTGSEKDVEHLKELYSQIGYRIVEVIKDKDKDETMKALRKFSEDSILKDVDSIAVVVGSHGYNKTFFTKDGQTVTSKQVYEIFSDTNCPALIKKPKLFVFNQCRGKEKNKDPEYPYGSPQQEKSDYTVSNTKVLHSTGYKCDSYRDDKFGSIYIIETCKAFMDNAWESELGHLNKIVQDGLDKYTGIHQPCELEDFAELQFYFNPKCDKCKDDSANLCSGKHLYLGEQQESKSSLSKDGNLGGQQGTKETYRKDGKSDETPPNRSCRKDGKSDETQPKRSWKKDCQRQSKISWRKDGKSDETPPKEHVSILLIDNLKAGKDMDKLKLLFENLGYINVEPFSNIECMELKRVMNDFKKKTHGETAFIIFYGDGFGDYIVTSDKYAIHIKELQKEFNDINCPNLKSKPKIFITNLRYYGEDYKSGHTHISKSNYKELKEGFESHMFFLKVAMEGKPHKYVYLLTEALSQVLTENKSPTKLMEIMHSVSAKMDELQGKDTKDYICTLRTIRFPLDFVISPIKTVEYAAENPGSQVAENYEGHAGPSKIYESKADPEKEPELPEKSKLPPRVPPDNSEMGAVKKDIASDVIHGVLSSTEMISHVHSSKTRSTYNQLNSEGLNIEDYNFLKVYKIMQTEMKGVLYFTFLIGCPKLPTQTLTDYLTSAPLNMSNGRIRKIFNKSQRETLDRDPSGKTFDISLLLNAIELSCQGLSPELNDLIRRIKDFKNRVLHEDKSLSLTTAIPEMQDLVEDTYLEISKCYGIDVTNEISVMKANIDTIRKVPCSLSDN